mgnify:CR=1 FL=1
MKLLFKHLGKKQGECPHQNLKNFCNKTAKSPPASPGRFRTDPYRADHPITRSFKVAYGHCLMAVLCIAATSLICSNHNDAFSVE